MPSARASSATPTPGTITPSAAARARAPDAPSFLPPAWVTRWMILTTLIVSWDAGWTALPGARDPSHWLLRHVYKPYHETYSKLDMFYASDEVFEKAVGGANAFGPAQTALNVAEIAAQLVYLHLALRLQSPAAAVVGLCVSMATLAKTVLYFVMLFFYGWERMLVGTMSQRILLFLIPNGIWSACARMPHSMLAQRSPISPCHTHHPLTLAALQLWCRPWSCTRWAASWRLLQRLALGRPSRRAAATATAQEMREYRAQEAWALRRRWS